MSIIKKNVNEFNKDVEGNKGYKYTTNASFSSIVSNKRMNEEVRKKINRNIKTLIDIGCGDGTYTNDLKMLNKDILITGIDPSTNAINIAKKKYKDICFFNFNSPITKFLKKKQCRKNYHIRNCQIFPHHSISLLNQTQIEILIDIKLYVTAKLDI